MAPQKKTMNEFVYLVDMRSQNATSSLGGRRITWKSDASPPNCRTGKPFLCATTRVAVYAPPDFCHPCTELGKTVLCSPLQGVCPCGCLAKGVAFREKLQSTAPAQPDCRNPKFAERSDVSLRALEGLSRRSARRKCPAECVNMP